MLLVVNFLRNWCWREKTRFLRKGQDANLGLWSGWSSVETLKGWTSYTHGASLGVSVLGRWRAIPKGFSRCRYPFVQISRYEMLVYWFRRNKTQKEKEVLKFLLNGVMKSIITKFTMTSGKERKKERCSFSLFSRSAKLTAEPWRIKKV